MRTHAPKFSFSSLLSCFKSGPSIEVATQADVGITANSSPSINSAGNKPPKSSGRHYLLKRIDSSKPSTDLELAGVASHVDKRAFAQDDTELVNPSSRFNSFKHTSKDSIRKPQLANPLGHRDQPVRQLTMRDGAANYSKKSIKEEETLLTLRFEILKLPTDLNVRCNASLAKILDISHPGHRIDMLEQLLSKISHRFSEKNSPHSVVMTSHLGVVTEMSREKQQEVITMRHNLLKLSGPHATDYQNLLKDALARPDSKERDDFLTQMAKDVEARLLRT